MITADKDLYDKILSMEVKSSDTIYKPAVRTVKKVVKLMENRGKWVISKCFIDCDSVYVIRRVR